MIWQFTGIVFINLRFDTIYVNTASVTELYHYGTVCQKIVSAATVNSFKARLDRFWANEEIYYKPVYHAPEVELIMTLI